MDTDALLQDGRTFVPARYVAEVFGATVSWDSEVRTVYVDIIKVVCTPGPTIKSAEGLTDADKKAIALFQRGIYEVYIYF